MPISRSQTASAATLGAVLRDDPRDRLSFPSKDGLLIYGRGGGGSKSVSSTANLASQLCGTQLLCHVLLYYAAWSGRLLFLCFTCNG